MKEKRQCCKRIFSSGRFSCGVPCQNSASVEREGRWYCKIHDPVRVAERRAAQYSKWDAKFDAELRGREAKAAAEAKQKRRADLFPELLGSLKSLHAYVAKHGPESMTDTLDASSAIIAKAEEVSE